MAFYNRLTEASIRTFRPIGLKATLDTCKEIVAANQARVETKYDLVAFDGDTIVGWSFLWDLDREHPTFGIGVADAYHGRRLGARLMDAVLEEAKRRAKTGVELTVVQDNEKAWRMYERRGFVQYDEFVGADGLLYYRMALRLAPSAQNQ